MSLRLTAVHAVEILDSRGRPTLAVDLTTPGWQIADDFLAAITPRRSPSN